MRERTNQPAISAEPRLLDAKEICVYLSLGTKSAKELCGAANAIRRYGKRTLFDRRKVDKYLDELESEELC